MKLPINQILYQQTRPATGRIPARFRTIFNPFRQLSLLRLGQTRRASRSFAVFQTISTIGKKIVQPVVDRLLRYIPYRQDHFQCNSVADHEQYRQSSHGTLVTARVRLLQFLLHSLDMRLGKSYSYHGMSPFASDCQSSAQG